MENRRMDENMESENWLVGEKRLTVLKRLTVPAPLEDIF